MPAYNPLFRITPLDLISFLGKHLCELITSIITIVRLCIVKCADSIALTVYSKNRHAGSMKEISIYTDIA